MNSERLPIDPVSLSPEQIGFFEREGYLAVPAVSSPAEIAALTPLYDRMFAERAGYSDGNFFDFAGKDDARPVLPQILMPSRYEPSLKDTLIFRNCEAMARQLLGPGARFVFDHAMLKPAGGGRATPWHQDQAFYEAGSSMASVTFWVPLQDVEQATGCLRFVPRSSAGPLYPHRSMNDDPRVHGLEALGVDGQTLQMEEGSGEPGRSVYCPLKAGGMTIHHRLTLHGAGANLTPHPRRAYAMGFGVLMSKPLVQRDYAWNRKRSTAREIRWRASLSAYARVKRFVKRSLVRARAAMLPAGAG